jgi:phage regulator Rha-like protein
MTSKEIAELTGKQHFHVRRDIEEMLKQLGKDALNFEQMSQDSYGRPLAVYCLPKDLTITLVSGYNVVMRHRIVTRWQELEAKQDTPALPNFGNPAEAARA